ncbi:long-chain fatty acid--CoA ligase [Actinoplanes sp. ATCC 53533]|uniref:AMP-binding protein n=1 Tax=Actinoplanes sp. ATCC 53533 TaxID=1288362 RepID=UPI000F77A75D|nr:AMP-binding protein [Actinoplanes sp. ATCC 53533]RSM56731.1 long-chain fatty acid--CoA ligase [Actinoplanes sp. ATCC 53533]
MTSTFPQLLWSLAAERPAATALQEKRYGIWQPMTWAQYARRVRDFAHGLAGLGVGRGDIVAVLGDNRPEWLITELAVQSLGGAVVGVYPTSIGEEIRHVLATAEVRVVVAEDQEQVDKLIALKDQLPKLATIVYYDPHGLAHYPEPYLCRFTDVETAGRAAAEHRPGWLDARIAAGDPDDTALICTTSGTTARPKLAELTHANLLAMTAHLTEIDPVRPGFRYVSFLPLAWIGEQMLALGCGLGAGLTLSFPEDAATQRADLREVGPDQMFSPPRIWESMLSDVQVRIDEAGWLKRRVFRWAYDVGDRVAARRVRGVAPGPVLRLAHVVASAVGLRPVRDQLGLARIKRCYTGGAPLSPEVFRFFHAIGVNLKQIYGQTEICGIAVAHRDDDVRFHTVGRPIPGAELRLSDDGEILLRSASVFRGYLHSPAATADAKDGDGWLHTGDAGYLDDGHLVVIDRLADVLRLPDGTRFSCAFIENRLKFSPYVEEAVAFHGGGGITAILCVDAATVGAWAERIRLGYTTYTDLAGRAEVGELLAEEIARANADLPEAIRVRRFVLLHKQLDPDDDEITRTRKVRRSVVADRYAGVVAALDRGDGTVEVHTTVSYQDGSTATRTVTLAVRSPLDVAALASRRRRPVWSGRT